MLRYVPIAVWLLCWLTFASSYLLSINEGFVEACFPYVDGCTSISKTGRFGNAYFVFKALMMPAGSLMIVYWILVVHWLETIKGRRGLIEQAILALGTLSGVFLIVYTTFLGSEGEPYRMLRQYGTNLSFLFSFIAYVILAFVVRRIFTRDRLVTLYILLCAFVAVDGLNMAIVKQFLIDNSWLENSTEWRAATILTFFPFLVWLFWRKTNFEIRFGTRK